MPRLSIHEHDMSPELKFDPSQDYAPTSPATGSTSHQSPKGSETTMLRGLYDGGKFDHVFSVALQDEFPWHEVDDDKYTQRIPATIVPALLQGASDLSPSRSSLDGKDNFREVDQDSDDSKDVLPRYSATQKGKWRAQKGDNVSRWVTSPSPQFHLDSDCNTVEDWVIHNRPILQDYADRQTSLPLGRRLEVSIDEPSEFILGAIQLLVNRDKRGCTDRSRQLGPQLIENFVNVDRWAQEYFRSRHGTQVVDSDVSTLLTIVMNNFYEGQVQLIDRLVEFALDNMRTCGKSHLGVEDFAFGFGSSSDVISEKTDFAQDLRIDFKMSQDLPFYVETSSRVREPLPVRAVEVPTPGPVITSSGRQVKPTMRAQAAFEQTQTNASGRRNKEKNTSQVKDKRATKDSVSAACQKKSPAQPPFDRTTPEIPQPSQTEVHVPARPKKTPENPKHRPTRPSNLGLPPTLPKANSSSTPGNTHPRSDDSSKSKPSVSAPVDSPKATSSSGSGITVRSPPRLKITIPGLSSRPSRVPATTDSGSTLGNTNSSADALGNTNRGRGASRSRGARPPSSRHGRGRGRERENRSITLRAEISEDASDSTPVLPGTRLVGAGGIVASPTANRSVARPTVINIHMGAAGTTSGTRAEGTDHNMTTCVDGPRPSQCKPTGKPRQLPNDPGHSQKKKRKLDDCED